MALTKEDLQAIGELMDNRLEPINTRLDGIDKRLDTMQEDIDQIKDDTAITREAVNGLGEWVEVAASALKIKYPV